AREMLDLRLKRERLSHEPRRLDERMRRLAFLGFGEHAARATSRDRETGEHRQLASEGLGRGHPDLWPRKRRHHDFTLTRDCRGGHVDHSKRVLLMLLGIA